MGPLHITGGVPAGPLAQPAYAFDLAWITPGLVDQLSTHMQYRNGRGIGNLMLEVLMRPGQSSRPDHDAALLLQVLPQILSHLYDLPVELCYPGAFESPYLDRHAGVEKASWERGLFGYLIVMAFTLGASRDVLPSPHDTLLGYYRETARQQQECLQATVAQYLRDRKRIEASLPQPAPTAQQVRDALTAELLQIIRLLRMGTSPETIAADLEQQFLQPPSATNEQPLTQDDLESL